MLSQALAHAVLIVGAIFMVLPLVFMIVSSIKPPAEIFEATFSLWPRNFYAVENFRTALTTAPLFRFLVNGAIVCGGILLVQLLVAIPCAYALAKLSFPGKRVLFTLGLLAVYRLGGHIPIPGINLDRWAEIFSRQSGGCSTLSYGSRLR